MCIPCCFTVSTAEVALIERWGKFHRLAQVWKTTWWNVNAAFAVCGGRTNKIYRDAHVFLTLILLLCSQDLTLRSARASSKLVAFRFASNSSMFASKQKHSTMCFWKQSSRSSIKSFATSATKRSTLLPIRSSKSRPMYTTYVTLTANQTAADAIPHGARFFSAQVMRSQLPTLELDSVFEAKEELAVDVKNSLTETMTSYGYQIVQVSSLFR
jgi:gluconate kinase